MFLNASNTSLHRQGKIGAYKVTRNDWERQIDSSIVFDSLFGQTGGSLHSNLTISSLSIVPQTRFFVTFILLSGKIKFHATTRKLDPNFFVGIRNFAGILTFWITKTSRKRWTDSHLRVISLTDRGLSAFQWTWQLPFCCRLMPALLTASTDLNKCNAETRNYLQISLQLLLNWSFHRIAFHNGKFPVKWNDFCSISPFWFIKYKQIRLQTPCQRIFSKLKGK